MGSAAKHALTFSWEPIMIRTITDTENIPARISQVLDMDHPRWLEKVLLLVGFYTAPKRMIRTIKVNGKRKARTQAQQQKKSDVRVRKTAKPAKAAQGSNGAQGLVPSAA